MNRTMLKNCRACDNEISKYSPFCKNCGHPQGSNLIICLLVLFLIFVLASYTAFMCYCSCHPELFAVQKETKLLNERR
jgi:predicted amidophosphoribosyltransferase